MLVALGWWGFIYPELCLTEDTFQILQEEGTELEEEDISASQLYYKLLSAKPEEIKIKSKLWETLMAYLERNKVK